MQKDHLEKREEVCRMGRTMRGQHTCCESEGEGLGEEERLSCGGLNRFPIERDAECGGIGGGWRDGGCLVGATLEPVRARGGRAQGRRGGVQLQEGRSRTGRF